MTVPRPPGQAAPEQTLGQELRSSALLLALALLVTAGAVVLIQLTLGSLA